MFPWKKMKWVAQRRSRKEVESIVEQGVAQDNKIS